MPEVLNEDAFAPEPKFPLGQTVVTRTALTVLMQRDIFRALERHQAADWGEVCAEDRRANEDALRLGARLLSVYHTPEGAKFYVLTEWDRSLTTVMLPEDY